MMFQMTTKTALLSYAERGFALIPTACFVGAMPIA
jgi:hypothetical protein